MSTALLLLSLALPPDGSSTAEKPLPIAIEIVNGAALFDALKDGPIGRGVQDLPEWKERIARKDLRDLRTGVTLFAGMLQQPVEDALRSVLGGRIRVDVDLAKEGETPDFVVTVRQESGERATRLVKAFESFLDMIAPGTDPIDSGAEGAVATRNRKEYHSRLGSTVFVSNRRDLLERALAAFDDDHGQGAMTDAAPRVRLTADLAELRQRGLAKPLPERADNALGSLLLHGVFAAANRADHGTITLAMKGDAPQLEFAVDAPDDRAPESARWSFPSEAPTLAVPEPPGTVAVLRTNRDFTDFYAHRKELLLETLENDIVQFDTIISLFFGGRSFGEEVVPALGHEAAIVVTNQSYSGSPRAPDVKIPGFALVTRRDPAVLKKNDLLTAFQTTMGIVNADRAQKGMQQFLMSNEKRGGVDIVSARFIAETDEEAKDIRFNAEPSVAVTDQLFIFGSSAEQVRALVDALQGAPAPPPVNTDLTIHAAPLLDLLTADSEPLIANRMLEKGESRAEAESFYALATQLLKRIDRLNWTLDRAQGEVKSTITLQPVKGRREDV